MGLSGACAVAAAVLAVTGRGDLWVLALLLGLADRGAAPAIVTCAAAVVALDRFGSAGLSDLAGAQSVLGPAGWHGSGTVIAVTWVSAAALLLVCRAPGPAVVAGAIAGLVVAGPALTGGTSDVAVRLVALCLGAGLARLLAPRSPDSSLQERVSIGLAAAAVLGVVLPLM